MKGNKNIIKSNPERQGEYYYEVCKDIQSFINNNIQTLKVKAPLSLSQLPEYDIYIVGSDQVWRPKYSPCLTNFYLDFLGQKDVKRIAYAASFGVDEWETDPKTTEIIRPLIKKFDKITVREKAAVKLCRDYLDVDAELMPDPTLLLTKEDYLSLADKGVSLKPGDKYIACYILDENEDERAFIDRISTDKELPIKNLGSFNWTDGKESIEQWISDIANAEFVITDSFHGTVFSLIFQKDFVAIQNTSRGVSRLISLLEELGLLDHLVESNSLSTHFFATPVNYRIVSEKLEHKRIKGLCFLNNI